MSVPWYSVLLSLRRAPAIDIIDMCTVIGPVHRRAADDQGNMYYITYYMVCCVWRVQHAVATVDVCSWCRAVQKGGGNWAGGLGWGWGWGRAAKP